MRSMFRAILIPLLIGAMGSAAHAGAWLREDGTGFVSFGLTAFELDDTGKQFQEQSFFVEYGLRADITVGANGSVVDGLGGEGQVFLRLPVNNADRPAKIAAEFGLGATSDGINVDPFLRTGLSWGRGITLGARGGWVNVDGSALLGIDGADPRVKIDSTVGLSLQERTQIMAQSFVEIGPGEDSHTLMPSLILSAKSGKTRYVLGYEHRTGGRASKGFKFGLWQDF